MVYYARLRSYRFYSCLDTKNHLKQITMKSPVVRTTMRMLCSVASSNELKLLGYASIPGPKGTLANMFDYARNGGEAMLAETLRRRFERYGPIYSETMFGRRLVNIADADAIAKILRVESSFQMRPGFEAFERMVKQGIESARGGAILSNDYESWYRDRSLLSPAMMRLSEVNKALSGLNGVARSLVDRISQLSQPGSLARSFERELVFWAAESIGVFLFDQRLGFYDHPPAPEVVAFVDDTVELFHNLGRLMLGPALFKHINTPTYRRFKNAVMDRIAKGRMLVDRALEQKKNGSGSQHRVSLMDTMMASHELPRKRIDDIFLASTAAGIETTSTALLWVIYQLSCHPQSQEKLYQELKSVLGSDGGITEKSIKNVPYLKACVKESLRITPTAFVIPRTFDHDIEVLGYNIPAGVHIMLQSHVTSLAEEYYGRNAKEFVPERWLHDQAANRNAQRAFATLPFGYGVRMCLGRRLAEAMIYALVSQLLLRFRLEYAGEEKLGQRMSGGLMKPDKPLVLQLDPR